MLPESIRNTAENMFQDAAQTYDAILIVSFGGPEGLQDVMPYLENVLAGKNIPQARMKEVVHHYKLFDGVSPLNAQNRALIAELTKAIEKAGLDLPIYWGNRNWHPFLLDTMQQMLNDGVGRVLAFFTSAYSTYSSCHQYWQDIGRVQAQMGEAAPHVDKIRAFYNHPGFIEANVEHLNQALQQIAEARRDAAKLIFTAHSIPCAMAENSDYVKQLEETSRLVAAGIGRDDWALVYQSRSGPPHQAWLGPDIGAYLQALKAQNPDLQDVIVMPIGFISDHMEVLFDLDIEAKERADELGMNLVRPATVGTHPAFVNMIVELIQERRAANPKRRFLGSYGPSHDLCGATCCQYQPERPTCI